MLNYTMPVIRMQRIESQRLTMSLSWNSLLDSSIGGLSMLRPCDTEGIPPVARPKFRALGMSTAWTLLSIPELRAVVPVYILRLSRPMIAAAM